MANKPSVPKESTYFKMIQGYKYPYRIGDMGDVQKQLQDGTWRKITPQLNKRTHKLTIRLKQLDGTRKTYNVDRLMDTYFFDGYAKANGLCIVHRNCMRTDCSIYNLVFRKPREVICGNKGNSKRVAKVDRNGCVVATYYSLIEASRRNYASKNYVFSRVHNRIKNPYDEQGCTFKFVEDLDG